MSGEASERISQALCFFVLAAVLSPHQFGLAAVAFLAIQVTNSLTYAGLGQAVQALGPNLDRDRTAITMTWCSGIGAGLILALLAPLVSEFLQAPGATRLIRLIAIGVPLSQFVDVKTALMERRGAFVRAATAQHAASVAAAILGVALALAGAGPLALVSQAVAQHAVRAIMLSLSAEDRLGRGFHREHARHIWEIGRHLLGSGALITAYSNLDNATVSAVRGATALGGYGFVYNLANLPYFLIGLAGNRVMLPAYARRHRAGQSVAKEYEVAVLTVSLFAALPLGYLAISGPEALRAVFGHKWDFVGDALSILAIGSWIRCVTSPVVPILLTTNRAHAQKRAQMVLVLMLLVLVIPLTVAFGTIGTAIAVATPQALVGGWMSRYAAALTDAAPFTLARDVAMAAVAGVVAGCAGLPTLVGTGSTLGLIASLALSSVAWLVVAAAVWGLAGGGRLRILRFRQLARSGVGNWGPRV